MSSRAGPSDGRSARRGFRRQRLAVLIAKQMAGELGEGALIHVALEVDHRLEGDPVVVPAPGIELGALRGAQVHVAFAADEAEQEPYLLLPAVVSAPIPLQPSRRYFIPQPVAGAPQNLHVRGQQAHLFPQLAVHRLNRRLPGLYSTLRKLPGVLFNALAPENFVAPV